MLPVYISRLIFLSEIQSKFQMIKQDLTLLQKGHVLVEKPNKDTSWKVSKYGVFSGPYFPVFTCIRTEYRNIRTRKKSVFGHFSRIEKYYCSRINCWNRGCRKGWNQLQETSCSNRRKMCLYRTTEQTYIQYNQQSTI